MHIRWSTALALVIVSCSMLGSPVAKRKKKPARPPAPAVSASARNAAQRRVDGYLEDSAAKPFHQPGALVPFFEQLVRLHSAQDKMPVHIIHWGASHTAA